MTQEQQQSILDRVRKLYRHANSAKELGNEAEAAAFAAKVQELVLQHRLDMTAIEQEEMERTEPVEEETIEASELGLRVKLYATRQSWFGILINGCAPMSFCRVIGSSSNGQRNRYHIIGRKSDRENLKQLVAYLTAACYDMAQEAAASAFNKRSFLHGFRLGFAGAVGRRLRVEREKLMQSSTTSRAIVLVNKATADVDAFVKAKYTKLVNNRSARFSNQAGFSAGSKYGEAIGINGTKRLGA